MFFLVVSDSAPPRGPVLGPSWVRPARGSQTMSLETHSRTPQLVELSLVPRPTWNLKRTGLYIERKIVNSLPIWSIFR